MLCARAIRGTRSRPRCVTRRFASAASRAVSRVPSEIRSAPSRHESTSASRLREHTPRP